MTAANRDPAFGGSGGGGPATVPPNFALDDLAVNHLFVRGGSPWASLDTFATGDGVVDDTAAFLSAAAVLPSGGEIRGGPGKSYKITSADVLPVLAGKGLSLRGAGIDSTRIIYSGSGYAFQLGDGGATPSAHQFIRDLTLDASASATPSGLVTLKGAYFSGLERVRLLGPTGGNKILVNFDPGDGSYGNYFNLIRQCRLAGSTSASDIGIKLYSTTANGANSNYIERDWFGVFLQAILIDGGDSNEIYGCEANGDIGTFVRLQTVNTTRNKVIANQVDGATTAVDIATATVDATVVAFNTGGGTILNNGSNTKLAFNEQAITDGGSVSNIVRFDGTLIRNPVGGAALLSGLRLANHLNKTGAYVMTATDTVVRADATSAPFSVTLPAASAGVIGQLVHIKKIDVSANAVTVSRAGADTIDGATSVALAARGNSVTLLGDGGTTWLKVAST